MPFVSTPVSSEDAAKFNDQVYSPRVLIVTPTLNSQRYLNEAIYSVITQSLPNRTVHYHIQDGGSNDETLKILKSWSDRISSQALPHLAASFTFSFASEQDGGMYDGINRAFERLCPYPDDILTWINSDDLLAHGALATVAAILEDIPGVKFLSGRVALLDYRGNVTTIRPPIGYSRENLAAGLHDGRVLPFVMQEGTFFLGSTWLAAGGVDPSFKLAGDWDLWRRFARETDHYSADTVTGFHRRRPGQLSGDMESYYGEIDARHDSSPQSREGGVTPARLIRYDAEERRWIAVNFDTGNPPPPNLIAQGEILPGCEVEYVSGFGPPEGPYEEFNLPGGVRWIVKNCPILVVKAPSFGFYRIILSVRSGSTGLKLSAAINGDIVFFGAIPDPLPQQNELVEFYAWLAVGLNQLTIDFENPEALSRPLLIINIDVLKCPFQEFSAARARTFGNSAFKKLAVVIDATRSVQRLDRTLQALLSATDGAAYIVVLCDVSQFIRRMVEALGCGIDRLIMGAKDCQQWQSKWRENLISDGFDYSLELQAGDVVSGEVLNAGLLQLQSTQFTSILTLIATEDLSGHAISYRMPQNRDIPALCSLHSTSRKKHHSIGAALITRAQAKIETIQTKVSSTIWLIEGPAHKEQVEDRLLNLAIAMSLLGIDVRYVKASKSHRDFNEVLAAIAEEEKIIVFDKSVDWSLLSRTLFLKPNDAFSSDLMLPLGSDGSTVLRITNPIDGKLLLPKPIWLARKQLGIDATKFILVISGAAVCQYGEIISQALQTLSETVQINVFCLGESPIPPPFTQEVTYVRNLTDLRVATQLFNAADVVIANSEDVENIVVSACSCGTPVIDVAGRALKPGRSPHQVDRDLQSALVSVSENRLLVEEIAKSNRYATKAEWSYQKVALQLKRSANKLIMLPRLMRFLKTIREFSPAPTVMRSGVFIGKHASCTIRDAGGQLTPVWGARRRHFALGCATVSPFEIDIVEPLAVFMLDLPWVSSSKMRMHIKGPPTASGKIWVVGYESFQIDFHLGESAEILLPLPNEVGVFRLHFQSNLLQTSGENVGSLYISAWELLYLQRLPFPPSSDLGSVDQQPLFGREVPVLRQEGDWCRLCSFYGEEQSYSDLGLHMPFCWTQGSSFAVRLKVDRAGKRFVKLVLTGAQTNQSIRPVVSGARYSWSQPLDGVIGRKHYRGWVLDLIQGENDLQFELSCSQTTCDRELGVILLGLQCNYVADISEYNLFEVDQPFDSQLEIA